MARCKYCGKSVGLLRGRHIECHDRHHHALAQIPGFFLRLLESEISPQQFSSLLQKISKTSFIGRPLLTNLIVSGLSDLIAAVLDRRLLAVAEEERVLEMAHALLPQLVDDVGLNELFVKVRFLRELREGKIPDGITLQREPPSELRTAETALWNFNEARSYRSSPKKDEAGIVMEWAGDFYFEPRKFWQRLPERKNIPPHMTGDLLLTSHNIYFISSSGRSTRIPIARILSIQPYVNGLDIHYGPKKRLGTYVMDDPWLLANAVALLGWQFRR